MPEAVRDVLLFVVVLLASAIVVAPFGALLIWLYRRDAARRAAPEVPAAASAAAPIVRTGAVGDGEAGAALLVAVLGLALYGGYKAYREWRYAPVDALKACEASLSEQRSRMASLQREADAKEYELQAAWVISGVEATVDTYQGPAALETCKKVAAFDAQYDTQRYYFCRPLRGSR